VKAKTHHIITAVLLLELLFFSSCSTKKKFWVNRQYHNTTAKFNGYFNGTQSLNQGIKKIQEDHKEDYTAILPIYKTGNLEKAKKIHSYMDKAIKKGSVVIQRHSIKIKGKEYCKWIDDNYLLVGKAYFYKGDFDEAIKTFNFIKNEYSKNEIRLNASLWLARTHVQKKDYTAAEMELEEIQNERKFPKKLEVELASVSADYYMQRNNLSLALEQLKKLDERIKSKRKKVRYNYIMAQIYQRNKNYKKAKEQYRKVIKSSPEYEMTFNAKMNLARSLESGSKDLENMRKKLLKMTKDEKNKEYLDQLHYTLAKIDVNNNDTSSAIENYLLSSKRSISNDPQKAISFFSLAEIEYSRAKYKKAKTYYDSTIFYMQEEFRLYNQAKEKHEVLVDLIGHLDVVVLQDSLQMLAKLPSGELNKKINQIIQEEINKEKEELQKERAKQQMMYENNRNRNNLGQFGDNTSGGKWYFYNPATLSFGLSEFRKKWGKRKLEDDWRRKNKKTTTIFENDSTSTDSTVAVENKKNPDYYLEKLPKTKEDFTTSDKNIKEALYQAGIIYRQHLKEYEKSTKIFYNIISRFPTEEQYASISYYNIYLNKKTQNKPAEAEKIKAELLTNYPASIYAKIITNPNLANEFLNKENKQEKRYQSIHQKYKERNFVAVIDSTEKIQQNDYKTQYMFLRALSLAELKDTISLKKELQAIINISSENEIGKQASYLLGSINDPSKMNKANDIAASGYDYIFKSNTPHMSIIIMPKDGVDINYLKTLISDFHSLEFANEVFEISAMLMGLDRHILMIKTFDNSKDAVIYNQILIEDQKIKKELNKSNYRIMSISPSNFKEFYKNKDMKGYYDFFINNYLDNNQ